MVEIVRCNSSRADAGEGGLVAMEGWIGHVGGVRTLG